jgi:hypothetical protein
MKHALWFWGPPGEAPFTLLAVILSLVVVSSGCQKNAATDPNSENNTELHGNTKVLQAADLVGYDGTKLRKSVDRIKEASDKHNQDMESTVESATEH